LFRQFEFLLKLESIVVVVVAELFELGFVEFFVDRNLLE